MTEFPLDEVLDMQKRFAILYSKTGLLAICSEYVQVKTATLAELADPTTWNLITHTWKGASSFHAHVDIQGMQFTAVVHEGELTELGLEEPK